MNICWMHILKVSGENLRKYLYIFILFSFSLTCLYVLQLDTMKPVYNDYKLLLDKLNDAKLKNYLGLGIPLSVQNQRAILHFCFSILIGHA